MKLRFSLCSTLLLSLLAPLAQAGTETAVSKNPVIQQDAWTRYDAGNVEIQGLTGAYFSFHDNGTELNQTMSAYRLGLMLNDPSGDGFFRGNSELLFEISGGSIFDGPGSFIVGAGLQVRYNFVQPESRWVPYVQVGAGAMYNDVYEEEDQDLIGKSVEASFQGAIGVRYLLGHRWSVAIEGGYRFLTNFGTDEKDHGLHSAGAQIGLTRVF